MRLAVRSRLGLLFLAHEKRAPVSEQNEKMIMSVIERASSLETSQLDEKTFADLTDMWDVLEAWKAGVPKEGKNWRVYENGVLYSRKNTGPYTLQAPTWYTAIKFGYRDQAGRCVMIRHDTARLDNSISANERKLLRHASHRCAVWPTIRRRR